MEFPRHVWDKSRPAERTLSECNNIFQGVYCVSEQRLYLSAKRHPGMNRE